MRRCLLGLLLSALLLAAAGCSRPSKGVYKGRDKPVPPPEKEEKKR